MTEDKPAAQIIVLGWWRHAVRHTRLSFEGLDDFALHCLPDDKPRLFDSRLVRLAYAAEKRARDRRFDKQPTSAALHDMDFSL